MSTVPEVILARRLGLRVAAFSRMTNFAAGLTRDESVTSETKAVAREAAGKLAAASARCFSTHFA